MKLSTGFWQTFKETPNDAEVISHKLMMRAGLIQKSAAGLYNLLPMGLRTKQKIENIVRDELNKIGCFELAMTVITSGELWKESGRFNKMGRDMLKAKDRSERDLCVSPTNEEAVVDVFRKTIKSYKQLPITLYQINTKFRDEIRPRYGVMRGREFTMKDAYSFHDNWESLNVTYDEMFKAYERIFSRLGLKFIAVEADGGNMADGQAKTHEFQVLANSGEDKVIKCESCDYAANVEKAVTKRSSLDFNISKDKIKLVDTPDVATIKDVASFLKMPENQCLKSVVYSSTVGDKEEFILALLLGDDEVNEVKLQSHLRCDHLKAATDSELKALGLPKGFIGPHGINGKLKIIYESSVDLSACYSTGGLELDKHFINFIPSRDDKNINEADFRISLEGDLCSVCNTAVKEIRGIEVGHIFQLGDKYTKAMDVAILDKNGKRIHPFMGCYGLGIERTLASAIEQGHDEAGIIWPASIAPYQVYFVLISKDRELNEKALELYNQLIKENIEVILDDRNAGPGFKFKDAELLGLPLMLVLGERDYKKDGKLEIRVRSTEQKVKVDLVNVADEIQKLLKTLDN